MPYCVRGLLLFDLPAVEEKAYWLPNAYEKYYLILKKAANNAEALDRCVTVLSATLDLEQSRPDHPIFRILCKQENGVTYNEMVDGLSFKTLTTVVPDPVELEKIEQKKREKSAAMQWQQCLESVEEKARLIQNSKIITRQKPDNLPDENGVTRYLIDFDGENMYGESLSYQVECLVSETDAPKVKVYPRKAKF